MLRNPVKEGAAEMTRPLDEIEALVRDRICGCCLPRADACEGQPVGRCVLFELFPLVVQAILATESRRLEDYRRAIREHVCSVCVEAALDGGCELRDQGRCALDLHLGDIVEAVRQATGRSVEGLEPAVKAGDGPGAPGAGE